MKWFRSYHGTVDDPKIIAVAISAKLHRCFVLGVWQAILEHASMQADRGDISTLTPRDIGIRLVMDFAEVEAIMAAMFHEGMIDESRVVAWDKRQKPSDNGAKRIAEWRKRGSKGAKPAKINDEGGSESNDTSEHVTLQSENVTTLFRQTLIESESTNVDSSPPITPRADVITAIKSEPKAIADAQFELIVPEPTPASTCTVLVAYGSNLPAKREAIPYGEAAEIWNRICGDMMPKAKSWPKGRMRAFAARFRSDCNGSLDAWVDVCQRVRASDFCCGYNDRGWRADIDFALQESSWARIIEGKYDNTNRATRRTGTVGAVAYLMQNGKTDAFSNELNGMSERERELLSLPAWQDALEGPTH